MTVKQVLFVAVATFCAAIIVQSSESKTASVQSASPMPLPFTKNMGQWPDSILFRASANGATMWFTKNGIWYQFFRRVEKTEASTTAIDPTLWAADVPSAPGLVGGKFDHEPDSIETTMIKAEFVGASESVEVVGLGELDYKCNYFIGNEPDKWRTDVPNYSAVTMRSLYPGVDVTFKSRDGRLESEMIAASSADLTRVKIGYRGTVGEHKFEGVLLSDGSVSKFEQRVASTTSSVSGVSVVYSTYLGGSSSTVGGSSGDYSTGITIDANGCAYVIGYTFSTNFPTQNPQQDTNASYHGYCDVFVSKLNTAGNGLVYSTYLGGVRDDKGFGIAIDPEGNVYLTGSAEDDDFPRQNPFTSYVGWNSSFVTKLNSTGDALIYSSYIAAGRGRGIAVDANESAYVTGFAGGSFPTQNPYQALSGGSTDAFVLKLNSSGSELAYSTYLGGNMQDLGIGIATDADGNACVTGWTTSANFPTANSLQSTLGGLIDAFVTKFDSAGSGLIYSTFLGGSGDDDAWGIDVDSGGNVYISGHTASPNFPTYNPLQPTIHGLHDAFVTKINALGSALNYSTYLGGISDDRSYGLAVNSQGNALVTGITYSEDFPTQNPFQPLHAGISDAFATELNGTGSGLIFSTFLGGGFSDSSVGIAADMGGNVYETGHTVSANFPIQNPFQPTYDGSTFGDAFVTKFSCCLGSRGNANGSVGDGVNVVDVTFLVQYLFQGGATPPCMDEADVAVNNSINIVDLTTLVAYLFSGGPALPACP